jgi:nitrous oxide reductase accessory protein NosL
MFVLPHPTWVAGLRFPDGRIEYFDGPKDLFRRLASPEGRARPGQAFVTDYYTTEAIPAATAWFVAGSDVLGPMGRELIPFSTEEQARGFARDHRGEAVLSFREVTPAILKTLE